MTPILKDVETSTAVSSPALPSSAPTKNSHEPAPRSQPMPLEIQVTVNGARTIEGSDKREPFSESTKTVLVFANGAVIRLASSVAPGQLLFVTNEKSKKEVVCQVLKSRNDGKVTGYVELEFTEPATGFWGVRIPGEGVPAQAPVALPKPVVAPRPIVPIAVAPVKVEAPIPAKPVAPKIAVAPPPAPASSVPVVPVSLPIQPAVVAAPVAVVTAPTPEVVKLAAATIVPTSPIPSDVKAAAPAQTAAVTAEPVKEASNEELRQQAARLQEQLNALLFRESAVEKTVAPAPVEPAHTSAHEPSATSEIANQVFAITNTEVKAEPEIRTESEAHSEVEIKTEIPAEPVKVQLPLPAPVAPKHSPLILNSAPISLAVEETKIPSWLAPLARETESAEESSSASDAGSGLTSTAGNMGADGISQEDFGAAVQKSEAVIFGGQLLGGAATTEATSTGSKKGLFIGLAATAALLLGGGLWYGKQPGNFLAASASTPSSAETSRVSSNESAQRTDASAPTSGASVSAAQPSPATKTPAASSAISKNATPGPTSTTGSRPDNVEGRHPAPVEEPKKPVLGDVRLATPNVNRSEDSQAGESAPSMDGAQSTTASESLTGIAASHTEGPAAPLPVGGDVKTARLLKSTPPIYPASARSQRIAGNVVLDALIDTAGDVTSTKVISGPTMLHQAAMTAVKQWKYEPAQLDGKPMAIHLSVTVQFRLQ